MTVDGSAVSSTINITGNKKKNYIIAGANGSTLNGDKGNDTLVGGAGADTFIYENKTGKDVIEGFSAGDSISLDSSVTIKDAKTKRGNTVLKFKGGALTVNNSTEFKLGDTLYSSGVFVAGDTAKVYGSFNGEIDLANYGVNNFDGSAGKKKLTITGTDSANSLIGSKGKDSLIGGAGNDTLWGGEGANTFRYSKGDGKDVIFGFDDDDFLEISDTFKPTYNVDKEEIALKVGSGSVTFREFSATNFNINGETWQLTNGVFSKKE